MKTTFLATALLLSLSAFAGKEGGNGGHEACADFMGQVNKITTALMNIDETTVRSTNALIVPTELRNAYKRMRCLPTDITLDRTARTLDDGKNIITTLDWKRYKNIAYSRDKVKLAAHELAVGVQLEGEGEYINSTDIFRLIESSRTFAEWKCENSEIVNNAFSCEMPRANGLRIHKDSSADGICKHLGYQKAVGSAIRWYRFGWNETTMVKTINEAGFVNGEYRISPAFIDGKEKARIFTSITCQ